MTSKRSILVVLAVLFGCATEHPKGGTLVIAATGKSSSLFPPNVSTTTGRQVTELIYDYLTEVGLSLNTFDDRTFAKRLADKWDWSADSLQLAVTLNDKAKWHDGEPVRSDDVIYSFKVYSDTAYSSLADQLSEIDSVTKKDSLTSIFWFRQRYPLQFYDATSQMQILPSHIYGNTPIDSLTAEAAKHNPVGTGRYRFVTEKQDQSIELIADTANFRGEPHITRVVWRFFGNASEAARAVLAAEADIYDFFRPDDVAAAAKNPKVKVVTSNGSDYAFMMLNLSRPIFASRDLRRALTMALDREAMVRNVFDSLAYPAIGPTVRYFPSTSASLEQIPYDPAAAQRLLDSLGWRINPVTGVRSRGGAELRFKAIVPSTSSNRMRMATLMQEQLRKIGVAMDPDPMEFTTFNTRFYARDFDAAIANWHLGTSPATLRILWKSGAPQNPGSYSSRTFDAYVDSAIASFNQEKRKSFYNKAYQTAIDDAPAIWLYELKNVLGMNKRVHTSPFRPDAWWWSLGDWYVE